MSTKVMIVNSVNGVSCPSQYSVPVVKYDRNGFRPRLRQLIFTQEAAYLIEEAKIKQRIVYTSLKGNVCQIWAKPAG